MYNTNHTVLNKIIASYLTVSDIVNIEAKQEERSYLNLYNVIKICKTASVV
jgi:hypothetical protein